LTHTKDDEYQTSEHVEARGIPAVVRKRDGATWIGLSTLHEPERDSVMVWVRTEMDIPMEGAIFLVPQPVTE
jgi:hypothetical protein